MFLAIEIMLWLASWAVRLVSGAFNKLIDLIIWLWPTWAFPLVAMVPIYFNWQLVVISVPAVLAWVIWKVKTTTYWVQSFTPEQFFKLKAKEERKFKKIYGHEWNDR